MSKYSVFKDANIEPMCELHTWWYFRSNVCWNMPCWPFSINFQLSVWNLALCQSFEGPCIMAGITIEGVCWVLYCICNHRFRTEELWASSIVPGWLQNSFTCVWVCADVGMLSAATQSHTKWRDDFNGYAFERLAFFVLMLATSE
jgi:hypothetical protein